MVCSQGTWPTVELEPEGESLAVELEQPPPPQGGWLVRGRLEVVLGLVVLDQHVVVVWEGVRTAGT